MSPDLHLNSIGQIHLSVDDIERAVAFYRDILGMQLLFEVPGQEMAFFDCGGIRLYLGKAENPEIRSTPMIYYRVDDIHGACKALADRGVAIEESAHVVHRTESHELWLAGFRDPDGNYLHLMCEAPVP